MDEIVIMNETYFRLNVFSQHKSLWMLIVIFLLQIFYGTYCRKFRSIRMYI